MLSTSGKRRDAASYAGRVASPKAGRTVLFEDSLRMNEGIQRHGVTIASRDYGTCR